MERWKDITGFEGLYQVSDLGRVRSVSRVIPHKRFGTWKVRGRILRLRSSGRCGHLKVNLHKDGHGWSARVHRLVLVAFVGPCPEGKECLHGPAGVSDNSIPNLKWGTRSENQLDKHRRDRTGNGRIVIRSDGVEFISQTVAAEKSGCWHQNICKCCKGHIKTTGGYGWKYKV